MLLTGGDNIVFTDLLSYLQNKLGNITIIVLFVLFIFMFISDGIDFLKMVWMVLRVYSSKQKQQLIKHINYLLKADADFVDRVTNFDYLNTWYGNKVDSIIKSSTTKQENNTLYGVVSQKEALYYTDLQKTCIDDKNSLDALAFSLALLISKTVSLYDKKTYFIVGQAGGNSILASRVAAILGLRYVIVGSLAGKKSKLFGTYFNSESAIIVDDILFTGAMLIENLNILMENSIDCELVAVALIRSLAYQEQLAKFSIEHSKSVEVITLRTYLDKDMDTLIGDKK